MMMLSVGQQEICILNPEEKLEIDKKSLGVMLNMRCCSERV